MHCWECCPPHLWLCLIVCAFTPGIYKQNYQSFIFVHVCLSRPQGRVVEAMNYSTLVNIDQGKSWKWHWVVVLVLSYLTISYKHFNLLSKIKTTSLDYPIDFALASDSCMILLCKGILAISCCYIYKMQYCQNMRSL